MSVQIITSVSLKRMTITARSSGKRLTIKSEAQDLPGMLARSPGEQYKAACELALAMGLREGSVEFIGVSNDGRNFWKAAA